jgi:hypothetical protein
VLYGLSTGWYRSWYISFASGEWSMSMPDVSSSRVIVKCKLRVYFGSNREYGHKCSREMASVILEERS